MTVDFFTDAFIKSVTAFWVQLAQFLPNLIAGVLILLIGWIISTMIAKLVGALTRKAGLDRASESAQVDDVLSNAGFRNFKTRPSQFIRKAVFWLIMMLFFISAADTFGLKSLSTTIDTFALFIPRIIAAMLILILGLFASRACGKALQKATASIGMDHSKSFGSFITTILSIVFVVLALSQLNIDTTLLNTVIQIIFSAIAVAVALSLGLGTRQLSQNIVYANYARDSFQQGSRIKFMDHQGTVVRVGTVETTIESDDGKLVHIPNSLLMTSVIEEFSEQLETDIGQDADGD
ncbi:MAG: mechanosensitive ion channel [Gammaproteobacteria bacterium]|nr:mechanosensitive ion channel [Gammaproteobacteria bacterium]